MTAACAVDGEVPIKYKRHKNLYVCKVKWDSDQRALMAKRRGVVTDSLAKDIERLTLEQDGKCAICGSEERLCVDHDHATGAVRALLCNGCNLGIGSFRDDPSRLSAAIDYLANFA